MAESGNGPGTSGRTVRAAHPVAAGTVVVLQALADGNRLAILDMLAQSPAGVVQLATGLDITRQGTAKHLAVLSQAGLVTAEKHGRETRYSVRTAAVDDAAHTLRAAAECWRGQLSLLKSAAEQPGPQK